MKYKYRVRAKAPDVYVVEKKGWFFWRTFLASDVDIDFVIPAYFKSVGEAQVALYKELESEKRIAFHVSQGPWYFNE